jgi:peptide/nickel transport system ATP-binding protein
MNEAATATNDAKHESVDGSPLLSVNNLSVRFELLGRTVDAVSGVSFDVRPGEAFAVVGESGSGKSVSSLALARLLPEPPARVSGKVTLGGRDLLTLGESELRDIRGRDVSYIFQEPMTSLNPSMQIGRQIAEGVERHRGVSRHAAMARARELLELVRMPDAESRLSAYPHQLSGGMRQRVMIAIALACDPRLIVADEPTTALDVTIQAGILALLTDVQEQTGAGLILITHDLAVVAETADRMMVMYAGRKVEEGPVDEVLSRPHHPYTEGLMGAVPRLGSSLAEEATETLAEIPGLVPSLDQPIAGCPFAPRCSYAVGRCARDAPPLFDVSPDRVAACFERARVGSRA